MIAAVSEVIAGIIGTALLLLAFSAVIVLFAHFFMKAIPHINSAIDQYLNR